MTPTSLFAGVLVGLLEGLGLALIVFLVINVVSRRNHPAPVPHRVEHDTMPVERLDA